MFNTFNYNIVFQLYTRTSLTEFVVFVMRFYIPV